MDDDWMALHPQTVPDAAGMWATRIELFVRREPVRLDFEGGKFVSAVGLETGRAYDLLPDGTGYRDGDHVFRVVFGGNGSGTFEAGEVVSFTVRHEPPAIPPAPIFSVGPSLPRLTPATTNRKDRRRLAAEARRARAGMEKQDG